MVFEDYAFHLVVINEYVSLSVSSHIKIIALRVEVLRVRDARLRLGLTYSYILPDMRSNNTVSK
jgi:hypothetical protein